MTVERVGVSFEPELLRKFDALMREKGYTNRSEAIRDLVRDFIVKAEVEEGSGEVIGTLTIVYDHHAGDVTQRLLHLQHRHHSEILSTTHIHIDERMCLEAIILRGKTKDVRKLGDTIRAIKGVKHGELVVTKTSP